MKEEAFYFSARRKVECPLFLHALLLLRNNDIIIRPALLVGDLLPEPAIQQPRRPLREGERYAVGLARRQPRVRRRGVGVPERSRATAVEVPEQFRVQLPRPAVTLARPGLTVKPGPAVALSLSGYPATVLAATPRQFTLTAVDAYGNRVTGYRGKAHFTGSDPKAVLPADYTFTARDNGAHAFTASLDTVAVQSLTAADAAGLTGAQTGIQSLFRKPLAA
jgi:hypothetical protein